ncbi:hypothetical protein ASPWEDRAFT_551961 [Aspergillus wentii DTO 134E9]|uniref:Uncharacterized protein n=1 Tax=Aspergillus wentii DTO 134E9 TaxID=1073089 RepID=A0A1L9RGA1_ASPWE|nr:uncharacterized protein ASPWEDRAFT_551961 [Aspergillus wentii DTO 134E9]KAI9927752.1 hypothetical protein MW887_002604 [Aspergillus wentii]OJJ33966.1 hypothetical protein ASPWEDRAFT_551961 [Aspergillus wentii DTO 134E9]
MASPQPGASPRRSRGFSFSGRSERSHRSSGSGNLSNKDKVHLTESHEDKVRRNLHTKADPTVAMSEAQPMAVALEKSNLGSLRAIQHKDQYGNPIVEPDISNPTRPRFERPLDTIRSFEAAIYGPITSRPTSYVKTDNGSTPGEYSKRGSYFGAPNGNGYSRGYENAYGRPNPSRPNSYIDNQMAAQADAYYPYNNNGYSNGYGNGGRPRRRHSPRSNLNPEQAVYNHPAQNGYHHGPQRSHDTTAAASGSSTEPWNNSTNPSSVNSSLDQLQQQQQQQQQQRQQQQKIAESYGFSGFGPEPNLANNAAPPAPRHTFGQAPPSTDPNAGGPVGGVPPTATPAAPALGNRRSLRKSTNLSETGDKRKSWFKRKFTKS